ncbi:MAG: twin-arginine translocation signal domain-containing protein [Acidobacteriia bacterium]|nr:twin-arginine translocation signal domain-containing protein [Terriglobia bacterium]
MRRQTRREFLAYAAASAATAGAGLTILKSSSLWAAGGDIPRRALGRASNP